MSTAVSPQHAASYSPARINDGVLLANSQQPKLKRGIRPSFFLEVFFEYQTYALSGEGGL